MLTLILVRHGETAWNKARRYQGQMDVPLSDVGEQQAARVANRLAERKIDACYASDLQRAMQTAEIIIEKNNFPLLADARLREMNFGVFEGLTWDEANAQYPDMVKAWLNDYNQPPEGGEALEDFSARVLSLRDELLEKYHGETVLLVAHGGSLSELLCLTMGLPSERRWVFAMDNASITELQISDDGYPVLKRLNDACHLDGV